ncbi:MAG: 2-polyprenylphenol 6-hydroxylase [Alphaproteobacteria bacterium]|nr:2-polyprenylphenol 6-hydroxylase [Alphaproteobacteria bacterium]
MFAVPRHFWRALRVVRCLGKHGAILYIDDMPIAPWQRRVLHWLNDDHAPGRPGERLRRALIELGPIYIKLGQGLGTRPDIVGQQVAEDLADLQDKLPPFPGDAAVRRVEDDFQAPIGELFAAFRSEPVAAASIAQVHKARTSDGRDVAVKVLRPGIELQIEQDLRFFTFMARLGEYVLPNSERLHPREAVRVFAATTRRELDMRLEAAAADEFRENNREAPKFYVPAVDWQRTTKHVLTLEWIDGVASDEPEKLVALGVDPAQVLTISAKVFFAHVFVHGFFHGDMHPGNVFIRSDGTIVPIDYGIMGRLDFETRLFLGELLVVFLNRNYARLAEVMVKGGLVPEHVDRGALAQAIRAMSEPIMGLPQNQISIARLLGQLFEVAAEFEMRARPDLLLLQKTMMVAEGVGRALNPTVNMWQLAQPLVEDWIAFNLGPLGATRRFTTDARDVMERLPRVVRETDELLAEFRADGERGGRGDGGWAQRVGWLVLGLALGAAIW